MARGAVATIHLDALRANLARIRVLGGEAKVMAVVKADAYGHGLERCARALGDADAFGVASIADGLRLRAAGHRNRVVVLSGPDAASDLAEMRRLDLEAVIHHDSQLTLLAAEKSAQRLRVWLKLDTGMHRLGFPAERAAELHARLRAMPSVDPDIVLMTHFASSEEFDNGLTARQIACFEDATRGLSAERALSNSAGVLGWPAARGDWVRVGGLLYGLSVAEGKTGADFDKGLRLQARDDALHPSDRDQHGQARRTHRLRIQVRVSRGHADRRGRNRLRRWLSAQCAFGHAGPGQ